MPYMHTAMEEDNMSHGVEWGPVPSHVGVVR